MSDMPGLRRTPPPSAHEQHDSLLVAQLAAGDELDATQRQEAQRLVADCQACAALATDLATVSRAVAWEPVPPRRRDFRFDAQRAAQLRGSPLQRLLRRVSMPQAAALRPVAAGAMSVGLLFMVAGAVWPQTEPVTAPALQAPLSSAAPARDVELPAAAKAAPAEEPAPAAAEEPASAAEDAAADAFLMDAASEPGQAAESEAEAGSGLTADDATERAKALTREAAASLEAAGSLEAAALALGAETGDSATKAPLPEAMVAPAPSDTGVQAAAPNAADGLRAGSDEEVLTSPAAAVHDGTGIEDILLVLGVVLAAAGALLLLVVWLARRTVDPLLR